MAQVVYEDPIHHLSGKISKKYRTCYNYRKRSDRKYTSVHGERTTKVSQAEVDHRTKFGIVAQMVNTRLADPNQMQLDQLAFKAQSKYKTLRQYVWHQCSEEYDKQNA